MGEETFRRTLSQTSALVNPVLGSSSEGDLFFGVDVEIYLS